MKRIFEKPNPIKYCLFFKSNIIKKTDKAIFTKTEVWRTYKMIECKLWIPKSSILYFKKYGVIHYYYKIN